MFEPREFLFALPWLHGKIKLDEEVNLYYLVGDIREGKYSQYYSIWNKTNKDGTSRTIYAPKDKLKSVQKGIDEFILSEFVGHVRSFGFMGGSCYQAAKSNLGFGSVLTLDLRNAFSQIGHHQIFLALHGYKKPKLSFYAARLVADLCTVGDIQRIDRGFFKDGWSSVGGILPQGAPTSPRLFELCVHELDDCMEEWALKLNLTYTRYADNLFFASPEMEFPGLSRSTILSQVSKRFLYHKIRQVSHGQLCRMLGLNVSPGGVYNTRAFKRAFRGALHHLEYVIEHDLDYQQAWQTVSGFGGFAVLNTLPDKLRDKFEQLRKQIHILEWGW